MKLEERKVWRTNRWSIKRRQRAVMLMSFRRRSPLSQDLLWTPHVWKHSRSELKRLAFPPQPPNQKAEHAPMRLSKYQTWTYLSSHRTPISASSWHRAESRTHTFTTHQHVLEGSTAAWEHMQPRHIHGVNDKQEACANVWRTEDTACVSASETSLSPAN